MLLLAPVRGRTWSFTPLVLFAALLTVLALIADDFVLRFLAEILIFGIAVMSLDLLVGFGGLVSLGHAALFGGAAYAAALFAQRTGGDLFLTLGVGMGAGVLIAALIGTVVVRTVNLFFLILTLVVGQLVWEFVFHSRELTGGADGLRGLPFLTLHLGFATLPIDGAKALYITAAVVTLLALAVALSFVNAPIGRALVGSREQPLRMSALGYSIPMIRFLALLASGAIAGAAGALYPFVNQYIGPNAVHWSTSAMMVIMLVIGGVGSLYGAFVGAAVYLGIQTYLSSYTDRWQLLVGLVFVLSVLLMPKGIASAAAPLLQRLGFTKGARDA
jgi:branched-chain amino acid transport system permease protein